MLAWQMKALQADMSCSLARCCRLQAFSLRNAYRCQVHEAPGVEGTRTCRHGRSAHQQPPHDVAEADGQVLSELPQDQRKRDEPHQVLQHQQPLIRSALAARTSAQVLSELCIASNVTIRNWHAQTLRVPGAECQLAHLRKESVQTSSQHLADMQAPALR